MKFLKIVGLFTLVAVVLLLVYAGAQMVHLKLLLGNDPIPVKELTKEQKEEDFTYLTQFVEDVYPFAEALRDIKGITYLPDLSADYVRRAGETKDNQEFLRLFLEYTEQLRQAGHGGIQFPDFSFFTSYTFDIPKDVFLKGSYWRDLLKKVPYYSNAGLEILYQDGRYRVTKNYMPNILDVEPGAVITMVNGHNVDKWAKGLTTVQPLLYDSYHEKLYTTKLLMSDPGQGIKGWDITFEQGDGSYKSLFINKIPGYREDINAFSSSTTVYCTKLSDTVGYIYIPDFYYEHIQSGGQAISKFMLENKGSLDKLIIDIRGNHGGEITYWMDNIIRPLLKEPATLHSKTAVKKSFEARLNVRLAYYRATASNHLLHPESHHVTSVTKINDPSLDSHIWNVYSIEQELEPVNSFGFTGNIILLTDVNCISAGDSFASAMKQLKLAKLAGNPTGGWGNHYMSPVLFSLPNSGLCFRSDVELSFNADNRPTSIYGTMPDVFLEQVPYPMTLTPENLRSDKWVEWALRQ